MQGERRSGTGYLGSLVRHSLAMQWRVSFFSDATHSFCSFLALAMAVAGSAMIHTQSSIRKASQRTNTGFIYTALK